MSNLLFSLILTLLLFSCTSNDDLRGPASSAKDYSVFNSEKFKGSPIESIGKSGLFKTRYSGKSHIAVLDNGEDSFAVRIQALKNASKSIRIQALIFAGDESGFYIGDILKQKKKEGLDVRVIIDSISNTSWNSQLLYYDLQRAGIIVEGYEALLLQWMHELPFGKEPLPYDPWKANKRFHEKMWIIDGETSDGVAIVGGLNIANEYFRVDSSDSKKFWRDQDVIVKGEVLEDIVDTFDRNIDYFTKLKKNQLFNSNKTWKTWNKILKKLKISINLRASLDKTLVGKVENMAQEVVDLQYEPITKVRFFQNRPRAKETYINQAYIKLIDDAEQEVLIANAYCIPSKKLIEAIKRAVKRKVKVILLTNSPETNDLPEITIVGRSFYKDILEVNEDIEIKSMIESGDAVGAEIWEWQGKLPSDHEMKEGTIHAKYAVFDRRVSLVGSHNLDPRSDSLNSESVLIFENTVLGKYLAENRFYGNDLRYSRKIPMKETIEYYNPKHGMYRLRKMLGKSVIDQL